MIMYDDDTDHVGAGAGAGGSLQAHLVVLALHAGAPDPEHVLGVGAGEEALAKLHRAVHCPGRGLRGVLGQTIRNQKMRNKIKPWPAARWRSAIN